MPAAPAPLSTSLVELVSELLRVKSALGVPLVSPFQVTGALAVSDPVPPDPATRCPLAAMATPPTVPFPPIDAPPATDIALAAAMAPLTKTVPALMAVG